MSPAPLPDQAARTAIREELDTTLVVEAAAGTGKTTELVARLVATLRTGRTRLSRIAAVTFTEKAAGEMKLRVRAEIEKARQEAGERAADPERAALDAALSELEVARVGTIHSLCADILHERPVEARVDPLFEVAAADESRQLFEAAFDGWFQRTLASPPEGIRRFLRRRARGRSGGVRDQLRDAAWHLVDHRDFGYPWRRDPFDRLPAIDGALAELSDLGALAARSQRTSYLKKNLEEVQRFIDDVRHREGVRPRDPDGLESELRDLARHKSWTWKGSGDLFGPGLPRAEVVARRDAAHAHLKALVESCDADLASCLHAELRPLVDEYEALKTRAGRLDFFDLLQKTRDLLKENRAVRQELQARFTHIFVDEFQDTDPLQAEIVVLLGADDPAVSDWRRARTLPGKLFVVGDPKQSIYRFRRADVALYQEVKQLLCSHGARAVQLSTSFRGAPDLQEVVNASFGPRMALDGPFQPDYVKLEPFRSPVTGRPSVIALPVPRPYGDYGTVLNWKIDESFPDAVGAWVDWLLTRSGWRVTERSGEEIPVAARHVCLLFKRFQSFDRDVTLPYARALEARHVPHVLVGGRSYHSREEILALRNAVTALEWPDDELAVFATLRGPLFAVGDDALLAYRGEVGGKLNPMRAVDAARLSEAARETAGALAVLGRLHQGRNRRPIAQTLTELLQETRAHAGIAFWSAGEQALANSLRLVDMARRFEGRGATSFRSFVEKLQADEQRSEAEDAPIVEEGSDGVRLMTVHRAKGLEFPVVILCDPTAQASSEHPSRHVETEKGLWAEQIAGCAPRELLEHRDDAIRRDSEEAVRVAYVAATRARDVLVVPVVGDAPLAGWLEVLHPAIYPNDEERRRSAEGPGCPLFGKDSVLERPSEARRGSEASVCPGLHLPRAGSHRVVWWDPAVLALDAEVDTGIRAQRILHPDEGPSAAAAQQLHEAWMEERQDRVLAAATPMARIRTATQLEGEEVGATIRFEATGTDRGGRPGGKRFGTLVHAILSVAELEATPDQLRRLGVTQARVVGSDPAEIASACAAAEGALKHPLMRRAARALEVRRETPVSLVSPEGELIEGVIDFAFREPTGWTVIDFKTDREIEENSRAKYQAQLALYIRAVAQASRLPAVGVLLSV